MGTYTVIVRTADDNISGNFTAGVDYVEQTLSVTVNNVNPMATINAPLEAATNASINFTFTAMDDSNTV